MRNALATSKSTKCSPFHSEGMVRIETYVTRERRALIKAHCKARGYSQSALLQKLLRREVPESDS